MSFRRLLVCLPAILAVLLSVSIAYAVAPSPEALEKWKAEGVLEEKLAPLIAFKAAGGCSPHVYSQDVRDLYHARFAADANAVETLHIVVILVDFTDWPYTLQAEAATQAQFDSILFTDRRTGLIVNPTGSMTDYYMETSYGKLFIHGEVFGWYQMPETYAYYEFGNNGLTRGPLLARHAVEAADFDVDYSEFNNPGIGVPIVVIHAGPGAETGAYGIWSHKSTIDNTPLLDGILLTDYNLVPEEFGSAISPIGVFCHEFGHTLSLPDLYDTSNPPNPGSEGLGAWSLMASGNYNGNSQLPAHFDPWCKRIIEPIHFVDSFINVTTNLDSVAIPTIQFTPVVYQVKDSQTASSEYWLVENRQRLGFDAGLPGFGLCIYHIDEAVGGNYNNNPSRYRVALEQADGLNSLAFGSSRGDASDTWPGNTDNRNFHNLSVPDSKANVAAKITEVGVWSISDPDSIMHADLDIRYSRPWLIFTGADSIEFIEAIGDGDGTFEEGETIEFHCRIDNLMRPVWEWDISLTSDNPYIEFLDSMVVQTNWLNPFTANDFRANNPIRFRLKTGATSDITNFGLTVRVDSAVNSDDRIFNKTFNFYAAMGPISVLIVDDDNGDNSDGIFGASFSRLRIPYNLWDKLTQGSPTLNDLTRYSHIFWATGLRSTGGQLNANDITALKAFLDDGGNLALGSAGAARQLHLSDSAFLRDYLHTRYVDSQTTTAAFYWGVTGVPMTEGLKFRPTSTAPNEVKRPYRLSAANGGQVALELTNGFLGNPPRVGNVGILFNGAYKTVLTSFGFEYVSIDDTASGWAHRDSLFMRIMQFFGGTATGIEDPERPILPKQFTLGQNYPNPFNPTTTIKYTVNYVGAGSVSRAHTLLRVFNLQGRLVRTLVDAEQGPGEYTAFWDGKDASGDKVASGVYLYRLERGNRTESRKMVLLK